MRKKAEKKVSALWESVDTNLVLLNHPPPPHPLPPLQAKKKASLPKGYSIEDLEPAMAAARAEMYRKGELKSDETSSQSAAAKLRLSQSTTAAPPPQTSPLQELLAASVTPTRKPTKMSIKKRIFGAFSSSKSEKLDMNNNMAGMVVATPLRAGRLSKELLGESSTDPDDADAPATRAPASAAAAARSAAVERTASERSAQSTHSRSSAHSGAGVSADRSPSGSTASNDRPREQDKAAASPSGSHGAADPATHASPHREGSPTTLSPPPIHVNQGSLASLGSATFPSFPASPDSMEDGFRSPLSRMDSEGDFELAAKGLSALAIQSELRSRSRSTSPASDATSISKPADAASNSSPKAAVWKEG